jgi:hypothetical protein
MIVVSLKNLSLMKSLFPHKLSRLMHILVFLETKITDSLRIKLFQGKMCRVLHMARCTNVATFGILPLHSEVVRGNCEDDTIIGKGLKNENMKKNENEVRKIILKIRMNEDELKQVKKQQQKSTERNISAYVREVAMQKPVLINYRNQSADDFLKDMLALKKELNGIGNNFNQVVHKLHILDKIPEFRVWVNHYDGLHQSLVNKVEEIKVRMNQLYEEWLQK